MRRREAFGTSGPRITVRFFGGQGFETNPCGREDLLAYVDARGVPMGGELTPVGSDDRRPRFVVWANADPGTAERPGTPLERLQIVKLWHEHGAARSRVIDVAGTPRDGAVDLETCTVASGGATELCAFWEDEDSRLDVPALYYARVLEEPSCRWTRHVCLRAGVDCTAAIPAGLEACCDPSVPKTIRERAWTSPIWYRPPRQP
jgi:hypothetical protein